MNRTSLAILFFALLLFAGCRSKSHTDSEEKTYSYPVAIIADTLKADLNDKTTLYGISDDFKERFLEKHSDYVGRQVSAKVEFPKDWGVRCIERLPEGKELWLMQSQSREWMYLVITSGFGTQRIIDLMPAAVNVANENNDILETEQWQTARLSDGSFVVKKEYEWVKSVSNATRQQVLENMDAYHRHTSFSEKFIINDMGRFELVEDADTLPDYDAVVFFYHSEQKPSSWDDRMERLQSFCEENNILYEEVHQDFNQVLIQNFDFSFSVNVDITPYVGSETCGMVLLRKGEEPKMVSYGTGNADYLQMRIKNYFKLVQTGEAL